nr:MAG TPA: hypothetical protein [Caudoviricetes sp.]
MFIYDKLDCVRPPLYGIAPFNLVLNNQGPNLSDIIIRKQSLNERAV